MKYYLANYQLRDVPAEARHHERVAELSQKYFDHVITNEVKEASQLAALPLFLTPQIHELLPKELAKLHRKEQRKGTPLVYRLFSVYDDIYRVKIADDYEVLDVRIVW